MPPKKNRVGEEVDEIRKALDFLAEDVTVIKTQQKQILELLEEVKILRIQNAEKDKRIADLERRVEDLEQYSRINEVVVTGLKINPRSYACAVTADSGGEPCELKVSSRNNRWRPFSSPEGLRWMWTTSKHATLSPGERTTTCQQ